MTPFIPRSSRVRGPLDPLPEPGSRRVTRHASNTLWGLLFSVFGVVLMATTPTGTGLAPVHMVCSLGAMLCAACLFGRAVESHVEDDKR